MQHDLRAEAEQRLAVNARLLVAPLPDLAEYGIFDPADPADSSVLLAIYNLRAEAAPGNAVFIHRDAGAVMPQTLLRFRGRSNVLLIDRACGLRGQIDMDGDGNFAVLQGNQDHLAIIATFYGGDTLIWGRRAASLGIRVWVQGGTICSIGEDCLFSENITIRTTDHHSIFDIDTGEQLNTPADICIGAHVWVGQDCAIGKGARIGSGAIIGARSLVVGAVPPTQLWAGTPARMLRDRVSWVHSHPQLDENERTNALALITKSVS